MEKIVGSDELLVYLHFARNDLTHGLRDGTLSQKFEQKSERWGVMETQILDGKESAVVVPIADPIKMTTPGWVLLQPLKLGSPDDLFKIVR